MEPEHKMRKYPNFAKFCVSPRGAVGRVMKIEIGVRGASGKVSKKNMKNNTFCEKNISGKHRH